MLTSWLEPLMIAFTAVFLAELGDKTQLMVLALSARYRALPVLAGVVLASAGVMAASVLVGATIGSLVPLHLVQLAGGLAFLGFAAWTLIGEREDAEAQDEVAVAVRRNPSAIRVTGIVIAVFVVAELGDKSMLAAMTLAAQAHALATWAGATAGEIAVSLLALLVGRRLGSRMPQRLVHYLAAAAFALFGLFLLLDGLTG